MGNAILNLWTEAVTCWTPGDCTRIIGKIDGWGIMYGVATDGGSMTGFLHSGMTQLVLSIAALAILVVGATTIATRKFHRSCAKEQLPAETELRSVNDRVTAASRCTDATAPLLSIPQSNPPATAPSLHSGDPLPAEPAGTTARSTNVVLPLPRLQPSWSTKVNPLSVNTRPPPSGAVSVATLL